MFEGVIPHLVLDNLSEKERQKLFRILRASNILSERLQAKSRVNTKDATRATVRVLPFQVVS